MTKRDIVKKNDYTHNIEQLSKYGLVLMPLDNKRPILKNWNKLTKTPEQHFMFEKRNIGILTGSISNLTVLDIDTKSEGLKIWKSISSAYAEIITPMAKTPSGGLHIYFKYNRKLKSFSKFKLRGRTIAWDLLNNDRQVVAPPSNDSITNKKYKWMISPSSIGFVVMPKWLEEYLISAKSFHSSYQSV